MTPAQPAPAELAHAAPQSPPGAPLHQHLRSEFCSYSVSSWWQGTPRQAVLSLLQACSAPPGSEGVHEAATHLGRPPLPQQVHPGQCRPRLPAGVPAIMKRALGSCCVRWLS